MDRTIKLYQKNFYQKQCDSMVLSTVTDPVEIKSLGGIEEKSSLCIVLNQTIFFPEGGGQSCDIGLIENEWNVIYVFEREKIIYHQIRLNKEQTIEQAKAMVGHTVSCNLNWPHRFSNMQRHCGEHILSAVFYDLYGGVNRGFHMGDDYMTIDINLEENPEISQLTDEMVKKAEWKANEMIWDNLPVSIRYFDRREEAEHLPMRKALNIDEDIILVSIGDENYAAGCVACCGTHPQNTGEVGLIKLYKWENYKGMTRITFDAGANALIHCLDQTAINKTLCRHYSTDLHSLIGKIDLQEQKNKEIRQELYELKKVFIEEKRNEILSAVQENSGKTVIRIYPNFKTDDLLALSRILPDKLQNLVVLVSPLENTVILNCGGSYDCGKIVRDNAGVWGGKGGGKAHNARAMFPSRQNLECFIDFLQKAF